MARQAIFPSAGRKAQDLEFVFNQASQKLNPVLAVSQALARVGHAICVHASRRVCGGTGTHSSQESGTPSAKKRIGV